MKPYVSLFTLSDLDRSPRANNWVKTIRDLKYSVEIFAYRSDNMSDNSMSSIPQISDKITCLPRVIQFILKSIFLFYVYCFFIPVNTIHSKVMLIVVIFKCNNFKGPSTASSLDSYYIYCSLPWSNDSI